MFVLYHSFCYYYLLADFFYVVVDLYFLMTYFRVRGFYSIYLGALVGSSTERILIGSNDLHRFWGSSYVGHADNMLKIRGSP